MEKLPLFSTLVNAYFCHRVYFVSFCDHHHYESFLAFFGKVDVLNLLIFYSQHNFNNAISKVLPFYSCSHRTQNPPEQELSQYWVTIVAYEYSADTL